MPIYTAFCRDADGSGTTWIEDVDASNVEAAKDLARIKCARDWGYEVDDVVCIGIAEGDVKILFWQDVEEQWI